MEIDATAILLDILGPFKYVLGALFVLGVLGAIFLIIRALAGGESEPDLSVFERRKYLFDTKSEFDLFKLLSEMYGDKYRVFPQVHYSHIIEARRSLSYQERFRYWNMINRKSADFVLCDRETIVPQLVIELDGSSHELEKRKERDDFVNGMMAKAGMPICHLKSQHSSSREYVQSEVEKALGK